jgi:ankyrin repeat protein
MECMSTLLSAYGLNPININLRFLLVQLYMDSLLSKPTRGDIKLALHNLPRGINGLDAMYEQAMKRIDGQEEDVRKLAKQVLSWITHAKRPLTTGELQHALAVRNSAAELDEDFVPEVEDLVSFCAGLVIVDEHSDIIRWVHYTTRDYFEQHWTRWVPQAQVDIASVCLTYLLFDAFATGFCNTDKEFEARLRLNPLYDYAAQNWGHHARAASSEVEELILDLLESEAKVSSSSQAMLASKRYPADSGYSHRVPRQITGMHLAAHFGLKEAMIALLRNGHDLESKNDHGQTPLFWAVFRRHEAVVKLLLEKGAELEHKDNRGNTPLLFAAAIGHEAVVKLLLEKGAELEPKNNDGYTPLLWATHQGREVAVKLLLEKGAELEPKDNRGYTPLWWAAFIGHEAVVKLLLEKGAELESKGKDGTTPLYWAAFRGHEAIVKLLLDKGAELEKARNGESALVHAAMNGHEAVVKLLLEKGAPNKDTAIAKLFLKNGAELE